MSDPPRDFNEILQAIELEPAIPKPGEEMGWVYFIACVETKRCKIGFTRGDVQKRLKNLQTGSAGALRILAQQPGTPTTERNLHQRFSEQRIHGEWFEMSGELFAYLCATIWVMAYACLQKDIPPEPWLLAGLRMLSDDMFELPYELAALL